MTEYSQGHKLHKGLPAMAEAAIALGIESEIVQLFSFLEKVSGEKDIAAFFTMPADDIYVFVKVSPIPKLNYIFQSTLPTDVIKHIEIEYDNGYDIMQDIKMSIAKTSIYYVINKIILRRKLNDIK